MITKSIFYKTEADAAAGKQCSAEEHAAYIASLDAREFAEIQQLDTLAIQTLQTVPAETELAGKVREAALGHLLLRLRRVWVYMDPAAPAGDMSGEVSS